MLFPYEQHWLKLEHGENIGPEWIGYKGRPNETHLWRRIDSSVTTDLDQIGFLYAMVRMLKPKLVFESGCNIGVMTYALATACRDNGNGGKVITSDVVPEFVAQAKRRCEGMPAEIREGSSLDQPELATCDFLYCDSSINVRKLEIQRIKQGCVAVIDDTGYEDELRDAITGGSFVHLPTPRGVTVFVKC